VTHDGDAGIVLDDHLIFRGRDISAISLCLQHIAGDEETSIKHHEHSDNQQLG
jgi:hypothetical protein